MKLLKPKWVSHGAGQPIFSVHIHPDGTRLATGGQGDDSGKVIIWNMAPIVSEEAELDPAIPKVLCELTNHLGCVNCVRWSVDGKYLASGGDDSVIMIWTLRYKGNATPAFGSKYPVHEQWGCAHMLRGHNGDILDLNWSHDQHFLASCSVDNSIIIWNARKFPEKVTIIEDHEGLVKGVAWDPVGKYLSSQSDDKTVRIWRTTDWKEEIKISKPFQRCGGTTHVLRLSWSPDGRFIVSAHSLNNDGPTAHIIERNWKTGMDFVGHRKAIEVVAFNPHLFSKESDSNHGCLALGSRDRSVSIWLTSLKRPLVVIHDLFTNSVLDLSWSHDGYQLIACSLDGSIAFLSFSETEIGVSLDQTAIDDLYLELYGSKKLDLKRGYNRKSSNLLIEDPAMLPQLLDKKTTPTKTMTQPPPSLTNDIPIIQQQVESRTADGRRRITPVMLTSQPSAPNSLSNSPFTSNSQLVASPSKTPPKTAIENSCSHKGVYEANVKSPPAHPISFAPLSPVKTRKSSTSDKKAKPSPSSSVSAAKALLVGEKRPSDIETVDSQLPKPKRLKRSKILDDPGPSTTKSTPKTKNIETTHLLEPPELSSTLTLQLPSSLLHEKGRSLEVSNTSTSCVISCMEGEILQWSLPLPSPGLMLAGNHFVTCIISKDNMALFLSTKTGRILLSRLLLSAPPYKIKLSSYFVAIATVEAKVSVYDVSLMTCKLCNLSFGHMISDSAHIQDIVLTKSGLPVIMTTIATYVYHLPINGWIELENPLELSEISGSSLAVPATLATLTPLQSLQQLAGKSGITGFQNQFDKDGGTLYHLENQLCRSAILNSSFEYEHWSKCYVSYLVEKGLTDRLRDYCMSLVQGNGSNVLELFSIRRADVLKEMLEVISSNTEMQRLYCELRDAFDSIH